MITNLGRVPTYNGTDSCLCTSPRWWHPLSLSIMRSSGSDFRAKHDENGEDFRAQTSDDLANCRPIFGVLIVKFLLFFARFFTKSDAFLDGFSFQKIGISEDGNVNWNFFAAVQTFCSPRGETLQLGFDFSRELFVRESSADLLSERCPRNRYWCDE